MIVYLDSSTVLRVVLQHFQEHRGEHLIFATHDGRQATSARALGFECVGV